MPSSVALESVQPQKPANATHYRWCKASEGESLRDLLDRPHQKRRGLSTGVQPHLSLDVFCSEVEWIANGTGYWSGNFSGFGEIEKCAG
jgi:hypothetical protein